MVRRPCRKNLSFLFLFLTLVLWSAAAVAAENGGWVVVDGILATIKDVPVLRSDVQIEIDFGLLKDPEADGDFDRMLELYLNRLLILRELEDIGGFRLAEGQAEGVYREYLAEYDDLSEFEKKLGRWGIGATEIYRRIERALLASMYTESRIKFFVKVLPSDIEKAYEEDPGKWGNAGVLAAWESIRTELVKNSFEREKERWLTSLRQRYGLVVVGPVEE